jgi:ABC-2 type transport system permease protein
MSRYFRLTVRSDLTYRPDVRLLQGLPGRFARVSTRLDREIARRSFRRFSTYRAATVAGVVTNTAFAFLKAFVLVAVIGAGTVGGLDATAAITFTFVVEGLAIVANPFGEFGLAERIRTGDVVIDLYRPVDLQRYWFAQEVGRAAFQVLWRGLPPFVIGALVFEMTLPDDLTTWAAFLVSAAIAFVVAFTLNFLVQLVGFWILDARGAEQLSVAITMFFSGFIVPVTLFPDWLGAVAGVLPFVAILQLPGEVFLGEHAGAGLLGVLALQATWAVVLLVLGRVVLARATRRVVVQGG